MDRGRHISKRSVCPRFMYRVTGQPVWPPSKKSQHCSCRTARWRLSADFLRALVSPVSGWFQSLLAVLFESLLWFLFSLPFCPFIPNHLCLQTWVFSVSVSLTLTFSHSLSLLLLVSQSLLLMPSHSWSLSVCLTVSHLPSVALSLCPCVLSVSLSLFLSQMIKDQK